MDLQLFQLDAFTDRPFGGNPAAVCPLPAPIDGGLMQQIALENNLSETAFLVPLPDHAEADFHLRWFTPAVEVDLCGHATMAAAAVVFRKLMPGASRIRFQTLSGILTVARDGDRLVMDFPADRVEPLTDLSRYARAFGTAPIKGVRGVRDDVLLFKDEATIAALAPDSAVLRQMPERGFVATAPGDSADFVTRCFFPNHGIEEDPVTGSAYCIAAPFWAAEVGKTRFHARQISARGGDVWLELRGDRLFISGQVAWVMAGVMTLPDMVG